MTEYCINHPYGFFDREDNSLCGYLHGGSRPIDTFQKPEVQLSGIWRSPEPR